MVARDPQERSQIARIAALTRHAHSDGRETMAPVRASFDARFDKEVDPDGVLPVAERARRAEIARKLYFVKLARKGVEARKKKKAS